jgi:hypothetical protein
MKETKLITNKDKKNNHKSEIEKLLNRSDEVIIVSPFMSDNKIKFRNHKVIIITDSLENPDFSNRNRFESIRKIINDKSDIDLYTKSKLHGKVYLFKKKDIPVSAIITSANFTTKGLIKNLEYGVKINDIAMLRIITDNIDFLKNDSKKIKLSHLVENLDNLINACPKKTRGKSNKLKITYEKKGINKKEKGGKKKHKNSYYRYWLKPIGTKEYNLKYPYEKKDPYDISVFSKPVIKSYIKKIVKNYFKGYSKDIIQRGDILILYAPGTKHLISVSKVIEDLKWDARKFSLKNPRIDKKGNKRWPIYFECKNLSVPFSKNWYKPKKVVNYNIDVFKKEFLKNNGRYISKSKKNNFSEVGQKDKMELSKEFGEFLKGKIMQKNREL